MSLALFQRNETDYEKRNHAANANKDDNDDYTDRPFQSGSSFHSFATENTDRTQITSLPVAASLLATPKPSEGGWEA